MNDFTEFGVAPNRLLYGPCSIATPFLKAKITPLSAFTAAFSTSVPVKVEFNGVMHSHLPNLQGGIVGIVDNAGDLVVEYKYDAWATCEHHWHVD